RARGREAPVRERHAGVARRKVRHLLPPAQMIAAEPVRENQKWPAAAHLIIKPAVGTLEKVALHPLPSRLLVHSDTFVRTLRNARHEGFCLGLGGLQKWRGPGGFAAEPP